MSTILILCVSIIVSSLIAKVLISGIKHAVQIAQAMADGDLTKRMNLVRDDEIGELSSAFDRMLEHQSEMIGSIQNITKQVDESGNELKVVSQSLENGVSETQEQSAQVSSATSQMSENISHIAVASEQMNGND